MFLRFRKILTAAFSLVMLQGCFLVNGPLEYAQETNVPSVSYLPIGIPFVLGGHGSSVPLTEELSLTAKHIAQLDYSDVVAYHPDCDVAVIKQSNLGRNIAPLGTVKRAEAVMTVGMGLTGKTLVGQGKYYIDVNFVDSDMFANCPASITDAPVQSGMSGGGAYNSDGELVGIISGMSGSGFRLLDGTELGNERTSIFVSTLHIRPWLLKVVEDYYDDNLDNLAASTITLSKSYLEEDLD